MKLVLCLVAAFGLSLSAAHGRIGETADEITRRYGPAIRTEAVIDPLMPDERAELHRLNGIDVFVVYEAGTASRIRFVKSNARERWTVEQVATLMIASTSSRDWAERKGSAVTWITYFTLRPEPEKFPSKKNLSAKWFHEPTKQEYVEIEDEVSIAERASKYGKQHQAALDQRFNGF